ncbi:MAG: ribosome maturation factor RimM [Thermodesulforhabdaceae bacterium]
MDAKRWVPIGTIVRAHGVRGAVKILPYGESLAEKQRGDLLFVKTEDGNLLQLTVKGIQSVGRCWVLGFEEIRDRNRAEELVGSEVLLPEDLLPPREEGEFFYYQLIGLEVKTRQGETIGTLKAIFETPAHDVYVVQDSKAREVLIPAVEEVVLEINPEMGYMVVDLLDGLMEDDH